METLHLFLSARYACRKLPDIKAANHRIASNLRQSKGRQDDKSRYWMGRILHCLWWKWSNRGDIEKTLVESGDAKTICVEAECTAILDNNWINITVQFSN